MQRTVHACRVVIGFTWEGRMFDTRVEHINNKKEESAHALTVNLFGRFRLCNAQQAITRLQQRRAQELFSYLLLHRNRPYPRETLASLLWEDAEPTQARKYLRQALWQIQTVLQSVVGADAKDLLTLDAEWVQLNSVGCLSLDVAHFEHAVDVCQGTQGVHLSDAQREELEHAVALYCGDLLEGWYPDWCLFERERLQNCYLTALGKLVACCDAHGCVDCGLAYAECILRCDPAEEQTHYHMMHLYWIAGHRTKAIRQYQRCKKILLQELGVQPSERTKNLYDRIRADELDPLPGSEPALWPGTPQRDAEGLTELMAYFRQLQVQLVAIEEQLKRDIHAVAVALRNRH
jgi:DNA-binding SARP family transcriptional activator